MKTVKKDFYEVFIEGFSKDVGASNRKPIGRWDPSIPIIAIIDSESMDSLIWEVDLTHISEPNEFQNYHSYGITYDDELIESLYKYEDYSDLFLTEDQMGDRHKLNKEYLKDLDRYYNLMKSVDQILEEYKGFECDLGMDNDEIAWKRVNSLDPDELNPELLIAIFNKARVKNQ